MTADLIVNTMMTSDHFSQWMGIEILTVSDGSCTIKSVIRPEMVNGFGMCHGGITFSIADSAFAFASNSRGRHAVSIETSISHTSAVKVGDIVTAKAVETHLSSRLGRYDVTLTNQEGTVVAIFHGTVFRTEREWQ
jgi:acyl-CoA thioesterase